MRIVISSGHGLKVRGASGYIDEVNEARRVVATVADHLHRLGIEVEEFHDDVSTTQDQNLDRIVDFHNSQTRDLDVSVHFNAYEMTSKPMGTEVLYLSQEDLAACVSESIADAGGFLDRGPKFRDNLAFLNGTTEPSILIELCFVDSEADVDLYQENFQAICEAIADTLADEADEDEEEEEEEDDEDAEREMLKQGDSGPDVAYAQQILGIPADGQFGPATDAAVRAFQGAVGQAKDGIVGPKTWASLDELSQRVNVGSDGISPILAARIDELIAASGLDQISWRDRGKPPPGYYNGMAQTFALAITLYQDGEAAALIMAEKAGDPDVDALAWCEDEFAQAGMSNDYPGLDTLRHLFVFLIGLGMRESSGNCWCGRDMSADNVEADTAEAGLFQASWNLHTCAEEIEHLMGRYMADPNGFNLVFRAGIDPTPENLDCYGSGEGAFYQWLARFAPAFTVLMTAVGLRRRRQHWGPVNRHEVEIRNDVHDVLHQVQALVIGDPDAYRYA